MTIETLYACGLSTLCFYHQNIELGSVLLCFASVVLCCLVFGQNWRKASSIISALIGLGIFVVNLRFLQEFEDSGDKWQVGFYHGFAVAILGDLIRQLVPELQLRLVFTGLLCLVRCLMINPRGYVSLYLSIFFDLATFLILYSREKGLRSFLGTTNENSIHSKAVENMITSDLSDPIAILNADCSQAYFLNNQFIENFQALHSDAIKSLFSNMEIILTTAENDNSSKKNLLEQIAILIKDKDLEGDKTHEYKAKSNKNEIYEIKMFQLIWKSQRAIAFIFQGSTTQNELRQIQAELENKDRVVAFLAHEVRTPINGIIGMNSLMESETNNPKLLGYCKNVHVCANMLLNLANSILDSAQLKNNSLKLNPSLFKLEGLLEEIDLLFSWQCKNKGLKFIVEKVDRNIPTELITDRVRLTQTLVNLLANALKFTFQGSITLKIAAEGNDRINFSVEDTGKGIKEEDKPKLFKAFGKLEQGDQNANPHGVGLGLIISNEIVKLLDPLRESKIDFGSEYGKGTVFKFSILTRLCQGTQRIEEKKPKSTENIIACTMPETQKTAKEYSVCDSESVTDSNFDEEASSRLMSMGSPSPYLCSTPLRKVPLKRFHDSFMVSKICKSVLASPREERKLLDGAETPRGQGNLEEGKVALIVDDNPINLLIASKIMQNKSFSVITALNGQEAIKKIRGQEIANFFKVILMDCEMPVMDGFEASRRLKSMMDNKAIPIVPIYALSANKENEKILEACTKAGMSGYLTKPLKSEDLDRILNSI